MPELKCTHSSKFLCVILAVGLIGEITAEYEDLKRKLKRIQGYWGETYYQNLLKQVEPGWPVDTPGAENEPS